MVASRATSACAASTRPQPAPIPLPTWLRPAAADYTKASTYSGVAGFFFAGDILGWDALACGSFQFNAMALEPTTVARLPAAVVLTDALQSSQVQTRLLDGMRTEFQRLDSMLWLEHHSANARLAAFLLCTADAQMRNSGRRDDINLPMPRRDIGSYLGLTTETVSRRLSLFHRHDWITLEYRHIHIKQLQQLQQLSES